MHLDIFVKILSQNYGSYKHENISKRKQIDLSRDMRFTTMWYVRPAKAQTSLRICTV